jgi:outer membrane receptor protein involved in Fe transport
MAVLASVVLAGTAMAQTPPPAQSQNPPGPNPQDQAAAAPQAAPAEATGAPAPRNKAEEEIVVTGSRVRRKDLTTPAPVTVINREQIVSSGIASIGDFLQQMPEQGGALNTNVNNGGDGETAISLRNLGAARTLVLVDGKRWVNGGSGAGSFVDLNSIPTSGIERVEVLKDGASAVYGSDAIAGVVNIITRHRMNGVEFSAYGGVSPHGDAQQYDLSVTGGAASDKGSFLFSAGYFDQKEMFAGNRSWAASALTYNYDPAAVAQVVQGGSPTIPNGRAAVNLNNCNGNALCNSLSTAYHAALNCPATGNCNKTFIFDNSSSACASGFVATGTTDFTQCQIGNWRPMVGTGLNKQNGPTNDLYNFQSVNYLITPSQRIQLFSNGDFNISNSARAYFQGSFVNRQSQTQLAPEPLSTGAFGAVYATDNFYNPFGNPANAACAGNATAAGCGQAVSASRRLVDAGGRSSGFDLDTIRAVAGIDGTLPEEFGALQGVFWDLSFNYGRTWGTTTYNGSVNTALTANALGSTHDNNTSTPQCGTAANPVNGPCTPANLFGGPGTVTPDMLTSMGIYTGVNSGWTQLAAVQANVSAELFKLASERPVGLAAGYEYRSNYGGFVPDPVGASGNSFDFNSLPTKGSYHVNEGYAELNIPLLSNAPLAEDIEVQGAARIFDYSTFGSDWTYKLGARWRPIRDVTLRGTYGTGFRAPGVSDLYGGQAPSAEPAVDPCAPTTLTAAQVQRCNTMGARQGAPGTVVAGNGDPSQQINSTVGGNPQLQPEKAKIATVGVVFEPSFFRGFSATLDYYNIQVTQNIGALTTPVILQGCYSGGNDAYCSLITRDAGNGQITNVSDLQTNVGVTQTSGFDFALRYTFPTDFGRFGLLFDSTYLAYYRQTLANGDTISAAGNYDLGSGSAIGSLTPKLKFNAGINYSIAGFNAGVRARYIGGFDECADSGGQSTGGGLCSLPLDSNGNLVATSPYPAHHVPAYVTFDLLLSYLYRNPFGNTTLAVGMRNIADTNPPYVYNETFIFTDPGYDLVGRFVYGRISHAF